jgi:hypothetical protein
VGHDVHRLLPSLHGLANLLSDEHNVISKSAELVELSEVLSSIQLALGNVLHPTTASGSLLPTPTNPEIRERSGDAHGDISASVNFFGGQLKRKQRPQLLPPSPEQRQKRKNSHAPL